RVELVQGFPRQAPLFHGARSEVLDEDIGLAGQLAHDILAFGLAQVEADRFLAARLSFPPDRRAFVQQTPFAQRVADTGRLDLDDFCADRKSTRLNSSHVKSSYAVFC